MIVVELARQRSPAAAPRRRLQLTLVAGVAMAWQGRVSRVVQRTRRYEPIRWPTWTRRHENSLLSADGYSPTRAGRASNAHDPKVPDPMDPLSSARGGRRAALVTTWSHTVPYTPSRAVMAPVAKWRRSPGITGWMGRTAPTVTGSTGVQISPTRQRFRRRRASAPVPRRRTGGRSGAPVRSRRRPRRPSREPLGCGEAAGRRCQGRGRPRRTPPPRPRQPSDRRG
jgi:hypothetical protein